MKLEEKVAETGSKKTSLTFYSWQEETAMKQKYGEQELRDPLWGFTR